ncbi:hypothetical protein BAUCODRAFT_575829 [Baudoinia panamericana UAMH 10762]|uniref:Serine aminopeptidase S33 domain-containing protein n=1 Tax=Baudoinia panamericana (strain UAMH 10762) TaxID=717646 RepID=M2MX72_BAUPA|nr:uncharacterized protein BAUCODRAFT_575829 [Baudoinia panamericana UAMH 10762]EMC96148.1 hypothetical protein BAUCODRAFT_575829 [Baudoinia panamericana UAMH 10762]
MAVNHTHTTTSGAAIHYTESGKRTGQIVLLLHGLGGSTRTFEPLLPHLPTEQYRTIGVDFEGFGNSPLSNTVISVQRYVSDVDDLLASLQGYDSHEGRDKTDEQSPVIIGHSLGSIVALQYASMHPNSVSGLGLLGVGRSASHIPAARERMLALAKKVREEGIHAAADTAVVSNFGVSEKPSPEAKQAVREAVATSNPDAYAMTCEAIVSPSHIDPDYSKISCPAVFVSGREDRLSPPERAQELSRMLGGPTAVYVVEGGHQPILSDLRSTARAMEKLFAMLES